MPVLLWLLFFGLLATASPVLFLLALPLLLLFYPSFIADTFFMNYRRSENPNFDDPSAAEVKTVGRCFYLQGEAGRLGVWHLLPTALMEKYQEKSDKEKEESVKKESYPVIFYAHGNSFDRTMKHRCMLYNVLTESNYHVFCFDYRGYGDSDGTPTEDGITKDARVVYNYVASLVGNNMIIVWGHSMGTAVATRLVRDLSLEGHPPFGLVLESAFNNLHDVVLSHPLTLPFRLLPDSIADRFIVERFRQAGLLMCTDCRISEVVCPILMLHAADDHIIPVNLAHKLLVSARNARRDVTYVEFGKERCFSHKNIYMADELPRILEMFTDKCDTIRVTTMMMTK